MKMFSIFCGLFIVVQAHAGWISLSRRPFTNGERSTNLNQIGRADFGGCSGAVEFQPSTQGSAVLKLDGLSNCAMFAILDSSGKIIFPAVSEVGNIQCLEQDPSLCKMISLDSAFGQDVSISISAEILKDAHTIVIRDKSGLHMGLVAFPEQIRPSNILVESPSYSQGSAENGMRLHIH